ncbi:MAG: putative F420-dependent oxidoreductase [Gammaproteobacteria bacterium]|jgi:probable F420-dependent oxidoreductase
MNDVKFGLFILPPDMVEAQTLAKRAEAQGFYSVSHNDHFYSPLGSPQYDQLECLTVLTVMGLATEKIKLVPAVIAASFRTPPMLAKIATSVDLATNGRFICGLGAGWQGTEYEAHGYPFPPLKQRLEELEETIQVLKAMWTEDEPAFSGKHFKVHHAYNNPRSIQKPRPPIMLGGSGTGLLKIAARHADIINIIPPTGNGKDFINDPIATVKFDQKTLISRIAQLHQNCNDIGRDPAEIELGGLSFVAMSEDKNDPKLREMATNLGFPDYESAQRAPVALLGTPDEVKAQLQQRIEATGITYYILGPSSPETQDLFAKEVMPTFCG